jgi:hypothetical protein
MKKIILGSLFYLLTINAMTAADLIGVSSPVYCSDIQGNTTINIKAPTYSAVYVFCWKQGTGFGSNTQIGSVTLDQDGVGSIVFPADDYPHGPVTLRISGTNSAGYTDNCYLQLYNTGGVSWNEGLPADPSPAQGMTLVYADDFNSTLSIGANGATYKYYDHKTGGGDFSSIPFVSHSNPTRTPFSRKDTYLRIRADVTKNSAGIISSVFPDRRGFMVTPPCYFECRFVAPNAPGSWPAFWLLSVKDNFNDGNEANDELDIIEAYGGEGPGSPNAKDKYMISNHAWKQTGEGLQIDEAFPATPVSMSGRGIPSTWYETPHVYGCKIRMDSTIYYCDNKEMAKHKTMPVSKTKPLFFLINLATGGGWPVDLSRYNGTIDMYVDYVRVYKGEATAISSPETSDFEVNVFPNPVGSNATIALYSPEKENISVTLHNVLGQQISSIQTHQQGEVEIPVDMSNLNTGVYFAKVRVGHLLTNKTIIKK